MATATAVRSSSVTSMARPNGPTSAETQPSSSSPILNTKPTPSPVPLSKPLNSLNNVNGNLPRTRPRPRPSHVKIHEKTPAGTDPADHMLKEPLVKDATFILRKFRGKPPSLILHLHPTYFRFDQQDGTFSYNSEMRAIIEHLKARTVPHDLIEELLQANVSFYDGCLIVEVHDHKSAAASSKDISPSSGDLRGLKEFTLHDNSNRFITPSPYAAIPTDRENLSRPSSAKENMNGVTGNMPAPEKPAKKPNKPKRFTVVLHPTDISRHREISILTRTPMVDQKGNNRRQSSLSGRERPTPLSAIPPTPTSASGPTTYTSKGAKRQRMCLEEADIYPFESEVLRAENPSLLLEPAQDFAESQALMSRLRDPLHDQKPSKKQSRKRTTAELAADVAQAAEEERIALIMDERLQPSLVNGDTKGGGFQPDFSRFKKFEDIKRQHEETARRKKEEDAIEQRDKAQKSEDEKIRQAREAQARQQQFDREKQLVGAQKAAAQRQAQMQQQQQQQHPQMQSPMHNASMMQQMMQQQASQGPQMSPATGSQAPSNTSPLANNMYSNSMQAAAMVPTSSSQGPGSPPRPGSAMPAPQAMAPPMGRQASQQTSQPNLSRNSTPQIPHATPQMRNMTPQPQQNQMPNGVQQTPVMGQQQIRMPQVTQQQMNQVLAMDPNIQAQFVAARQSGNQQHMAQLQQVVRNRVIQQQQEIMRRQQQQQQQQQGQMGPMGGPMGPMGQIAQTNSQMQMQGSPQANQFNGQMSPQANGMATNHGQAQMPAGMQNGNPNNAQLQKRMQDYRRSLAQAAQSQLHANPQANGQGSPQSPQQSMSQQFAGQMSTAGSPGGMTMAPAMNRNPSQFNSMQGNAQSPHPQQQQMNPMNQAGQPQQQQPQQQQQQQQQQQFQNPQARQQFAQMRENVFRNMALKNGGQLPPDAENRFQLLIRQRQMQAAHQRAQQAAGQPGGGMMMPGQGLQAMQQQHQQQGGMPAPGQMPNMQGLNPYQQQQQQRMQQAALLKMQQQRTINAQQNQQQHNMMNGMMNGMNGGMQGGMNNGMGRPG